MSNPIKSETYISDLSLNGPIANTLDDDMNGKKKRIIQFWGENPFGTVRICHTFALKEARESPPLNVARQDE